MKLGSWPLMAVTLVVCAQPTLAKPGVGSTAFCARYPTAQACVGGQPACGYCHTSPPEKNDFGKALEAKMPGAGTPRPLSDPDFATALDGALIAIEGADSDFDGVGNLIEIQKGSLPGDKRSFPNDIPCAGGTNPSYSVCKYDHKYVYRKLLLDFCGTSPTYDALEAFAKGSEAEKVAALDTALDGCLASEFWRGKNGQLWQLAHKKIRPVGTLKSGEDGAPFAQIGDYYADYHLYAWASTDDRDARDVLTADFTIARTPPPTRYLKAPVACPNLTDAECGGVGITCIKTAPFAGFCQPSQFVAAQYRSGNLTSTWTLAYNVMFTALPRNAASQAYRAYLGLDIAKQEGLYPIANEPKDYDGKGVKAALCQQCHATLDPLSYPFRNYNGLTDDPAVAGTQQLQYYPQRIEKIFAAEAPNITQIPESGFILGQSVNTLKEWGQVAANSDAFVVATVNDYWKLLMGQPPLPEQNAEFVNLWKRLKTTHNYRVTKMLHELIRTEAYGAP